jgi:hypothetical protein
MRGFYHRREVMLRCRRDQRLEPVQCRAIDSCRVGPYHPAAHRAIEHPGWKLAVMPVRRRCRRAAEYPYLSLDDHTMDEDPLPEPRMPWVQNFALLGPMGGLLSSCTTPSGRTAGWANCLRRSTALRAEAPTCNGAGRCARSGATCPAPLHHRALAQTRNRLNPAARENRGAGHQRCTLIVDRD